MTFHGSSLVFDVESAHLRIGLRIYFTALFLLLALAGDQCCGNRVKLRLMNQHPVKLPLLTGWLGGFPAALTWFSCKQLPAGWIGLAMIFSQIAEFGSDLLVSGLVKTVDIPGRCAFGRGLVMPQKPATWLSIPDVESSGRNIATQAQRTSLSNGGLSGIYWKVNNDTSFRADAEDVIGNWICVNVNETSYPTTMTPDEIVIDLANNGFLYGNTSQVL
jgi:hypothetical protein